MFFEKTYSLMFAPAIQPFGLHHSGPPLHGLSLGQITDAQVFPLWYRPSIGLPAKHPLQLSASTLITQPFPTPGCDPSFCMHYPVAELPPLTTPSLRMTPDERYTLIESSGHAIISSFKQWKSCTIELSEYCITKQAPEGQGPLTLRATTYFKIASGVHLIEIPFEPPSTSTFRIMTFSPQSISMLWQRQP